jgi:glycyl-tRNA synthetase beta chain
MDSRIEGLAKVVYHNKLGTQGERVERVEFKIWQRAIATQARRCSLWRYAADRCRC